MAGIGSTEPFPGVSAERADYGEVNGECRRGVITSVDTVISSPKVHRVVMYQLQRITHYVLTDHRVSSDQCVQRRSRTTRY